MSSPSDNEEMSPDGINSIYHVRRAEQILAAGKRKKEAKLKAIEKEYTQRVEKAHTSFQEFLQAHNVRVSEAQNAQMKSLNHALHKRQDVEIDIWKQLKALEKSRRALAKLLIEVCHARLESTAEIGTTGRVAEKAPKL
ncbi:hypothetical protein VC83_06974 [Pseudogymnoascus destructans]|uniref:Uncharacterized protein n=2 Tax=Pseudogymnoascus destructans TaxID=655981 RepID=L8FR40_PSED2|nr:uncharacterized protein VC83_06974 [Pseudogymnoascus destructans]ELR02136.1 hypothetical protein GMDG_05295 [Pseudogymnoascus destructans 20631-21]OAF56825.1 hypothetical protein VC83_06974 [Pseudogymnoascus destructans]